LQTRPSLYRKSTRAPETLSTFFAKTSSDFSQINIQATFDYISFKKIAETLKLHSKSQKNCKLENQVDLKSSRVELWSASIIWHVLVRIFSYKLLPMLFRGK